jgi:mannosylglycerate hydrolase
LKVLPKAFSLLVIQGIFIVKKEERSITMKKIHIVAHTHWDREWYFSDNEAFVQFAYHMDEVIYALQHHELDYYYLDGQLSILDDYLKVFPEKETVIRELVTAKKLFIGPWYTQMDEFVVAGESVVKNLQIGLSLAKRLGGATALGYLPDSFGQGKDMPKIYNGFGITDAVFWRGMPGEVTKNREFYWTAEDGSQVLAINIRNGYYAGVALVEGDLYQQKNIIELVSEDTATEIVTLPVGGDQRAVDRQLKKIIHKVNQQLGSDYEILESNYPHIFELLRRSAKELPSVQGEFISGSVSKIHRSIYSSRYDLKRLNDTVEHRLIFQLAPLMLMAQEMGIPSKPGLLEYIWKLLLKNHAHDSIGGCNTDKTNQMIEARYKEADQLSYSTVDYLVRKIAESLDHVQENDLVLFNTLPYRRAEPFVVEVSTKKPMIQLMDEKGSEIAIQVLSSERVYGGEVRRSEADYAEEKYYYIHRLSVMQPIEPLSYQVIHVKETEQTTETAVNKENNVIENEAYKLTYNQGQFTIYVKEEDQMYANCFYVEDSGDEGDTYDYSPAYHDAIYQLSFSGDSVVAEHGPFLSTLTVKGRFQVPKDLASRKDQRRDAEIPYSLTVTLAKGSKRIDLKLKIDNQAKDHRMRLVVNTPVVSQVSYADTLFGIVERANQDPHIHDWRELGWKEEPTEIYPMIHYANVHDAKASWTMLSKGIKEYQVIDQTLYLTLFRGVGYLGRPELLRRPGDASGNQFRYIPTPDSQLLGEREIELSLLISETFDPATIQKEYQHYATEIVSYHIQSLNRFTNPIQYFQSNKVDQLQPLKPIIDLTNTALVLSAIEQNQADQSIIVRLYNPSLTAVVEGESISLPTTCTITEVNLKGEIVHRMEPSKRLELGTFKPGEIKTFSIKR